MVKVDLRPAGTGGRAVAVWASTVDIGLRKAVPTIMAHNKLKTTPT
jgi:hypothetical protein